MPLCTICNEKEANQTGAHIFPAWMVATAFDDKSRTRDYEIIYAFNPISNKLPFFGRSVQPDKIKEHIGRDLKEDEIKTINNLLVIDNCWCNDCEKKFKIVEDYFLENVDKKVTDFSKCNDTEVSELENANNYIIRLFIYTLVIRAAVSKIMGFTPEEKVLKNLLRFINTYIKQDLKSTIKFLNESITKDELINYPIKCIKTEQKQGETSNFVHIPDKHDRPYCFLINQYIIQFYAKESHTRSIPYMFYGITDFINKMKNILNYKESKFKVGLFNIKLWNSIKSKITKSLASERMETLIQIYMVIFKNKFGEVPSKPQVEKFLKELTDNNLELGIKYSNENIINAMNRSIK